MLKRDEVCLPDSCLNKARDDEPVFVLLGRDPASPATIRHWIDQRLRLGKNEPNDAQIAEAAALAIRLSVTPGATLSWLQLAATLRSRAQRMIEAPLDSTDRKDTAELILVLARLLEGKSIPRAFGAPGDWGYGTEIGDALAAAFRGIAKPAAPAGAVHA